MVTWALPADSLIALQRNCGKTFARCSAAGIETVSWSGKAVWGSGENDGNSGVRPGDDAKGLFSAVYALLDKDDGLDVALRPTCVRCKSKALGLTYSDVFWDPRCAASGPQQYHRCSYC